MQGELILVRHGKAEDKQRGQADAERKLTEQGIQELDEFMQLLVPHLQGNPALKIWSSPMERAKETAGLIARNLKEIPVEEKEFLATGDLDQLLKELAAEQDDFAVLCVGHQPFLSMWAKELVGTNLPFSPGGAAGILFSEAEQSKGKLEWKEIPPSA